MAGASAAIEKTIKDIEAIWRGARLPAAGEKRARLQAKIRSILVKSSRTWYKKGFSRGHRESFREWKHSRRVPSILRVHVEREFIPDKSSSINLESKLTTKFKRLG
jgi:hypothetical protein